MPRKFSKENAKEFGAKSQTPEVKEKRKATLEQKKINRLVQAEVLDTIRNSFFKLDKNCFPILI